MEQTIQQADALETQKPAAMGQAVSRGATWTVVATVLAKGLSGIAQIVLGRLLSQGDFAVFGMALSISGVVQVFRDGGVREVLVQRGPAEYPRLAGPVFWLAGAMNVVAAVLLVAVGAGFMGLQSWESGKYLSESYRDRFIPWMLVIIAVSLPLNTVAAVLQARLRLDLKFGLLSRIQMISAFARNISLIAFAWWLRNPLAFVIPMIVVAIYEGIASIRATGESPWKLPAKVKMWRSLFTTGAWMIIQTLANVLLDVGTFSTIPFFMDKDPVGVYVFAYTWVAQVGTLIGFALQQVLFSALARMVDDAARLRAAVVRAQHVQMLLGATASMGLAVIIQPLDQLLWGGKWQAACVPVIILGLFFPFRVTFGLSTALMMAQGRFKQLAYLTLIEGVGVVGLGTLGAAIQRTPDAVAIWTGASLVVSRIACTWWALRSINLGFAEILRGMLPAWIVAIIAGAVGLWVISVVKSSSFLDQQLHFVAQENVRHGAVQVALIIIAGGVFALIMAVLSRLFLAESVREVAAALPGRAGTLVRSIMRV